MNHPMQTSAGSTVGGARADAKRLLLDGVSKRYGNVLALDALTLAVEPGELVSLLGPSGCGKTTTLRLIAGFEFPDAGSVRIGGNDVSALPPNKRGLGMVFQNYSLFPHLTVGENIGFGLRMAGVKRGDIAVQVKRMLDLIRLPGYCDRRIEQLSGGQQQRVALARAIVNDPSVLLLDEPLGALDKNLREGMQFEIRRMQQDLGITSVMVTHDQEEAMTMSDRVVVISHGRILQSGAPREVYDRPRNRFVAEFLGTANVIDCRVTARDERSVSVAALSTADAPTAMTLGIGSDFDGELPGVLQVALRPEKVAIDAPRPGHVQLRGRIVQHVFRGAQHSYEIDVPGLGPRVYAYQQASSSEHVGHSRGEAVTVSFSPNDVVVLEADDAPPAAPHASEAFATQRAPLAGEGAR
ncbi:ABC transporter ATP-binding protein [Chitinasiproducens palmae]|uniref:Spermidine/putrescine import ATP-binding protein PotA n=1 Tax=Chitinasiproducens palmae TaxID=1770053 RepID=A0A1H2PQ72_9BURK|nr:ABC transporter ATP-binding protein [Chitinasiproducens palmae]SDV48970.1 putative spermidine/putrescine transport system ATP-binding protein [Chitinasiproducens palmae]